MKLVGTGFGGDVDDVSGGEAVLGGEGVGLDLELIDAVDGGNVDDGAPIGGGIPNTIEKEGGSAEEAAAEVEEEMSWSAVSWVPPPETFWPAVEFWTEELRVARP